MTKTIGHTIKIAPETKEEFQALQEGHPSAQEFTLALLGAYRDQVENANDKSPVKKQADRIDELMAQLKRVCVAYMEIAADEKAQGIEEAHALVQSEAARTRNLMEEIKKHSNTIQSLETLLNEANKEISGLKEHIENTGLLKEAFEKEVGVLKERVVALDAEAQSARELKSALAMQKEIVTARDKDLATWQGEVALSDNQAESYKAEAESLKADVAELKAANKELKLEITTATGEARKAHSDYREVANELKELITEAGKERAAAQSKQAELFKENQDLKQQLKKKNPQQPAH